MALDSASYFVHRAKLFGLADYVDTMATFGWKTMGTFAMSCRYVPGSDDDVAFLTKVVVPVLGGQENPLEPALRRLHFEAYTLIAADAARRAAGGDEASRHKTLPGPERADRLKEIKMELTGVDIVGPLVPSHALVDRFTAMQESGELRFVPWHFLTSREKEIKGVKEEELFKTDPNGLMKRIVRKIEDPADVTGFDKLKQAFQRRGIALQMARLMTYRAHEKLVNWYFRELDRPALRNFEQTTLDQVFEVDQEIVVRIVEETDEDLQLLEDGSMPLDALTLSITKEPRIQMMLAQQRSGSSGGQKRQSQELSQLAAENKRLRAQLESMQGKGNRNKGAKGQFKGKGNEGKQGKKVRGTRMPPELLQYGPAPGEGRVCFSFNLEGCSEGAACTKGRHICLKCKKPQCTAGARRCKA